jgi:uncharacterized DUF497 family protein
VPYHEFLWLDWNIQKISDNGLTVAEVEYVVLNAREQVESRSSGRNMYIGLTPSGDLIAVPFEELDAVLIQVVTAFKIR